MSNGCDVSINEDVQLAITDEHGNIETTLGCVFPAWVYPKEIEAGDLLEVTIKARK